MSTLLSLVPNDAQVALVDPADVPKQITYATLRSSVLRLSDILYYELGVNPGDVVAMSFVNSLEFVVGFIGTGAAR